MKFVDVKNDVAFRKIFGNEQKKVILISFLNTMLEFEGLDAIQFVELVNPFQLPRIRGERSSIIDVRAKDSRGRFFIIEMQVAEKEGFAKRIQYYTCKDDSRKMNIGNDYPKLRLSYFVGIFDFKFFPINNYFSKHLIVDEETGICTLEDLKFRFIELPKFKKKVDELDSIIDQWTFFIKHAHKLTLVPDDTKDKGLLTAYEEANRFNWSKEEYDAYIYAGMREQDFRGRMKLAVDRAVEKEVKKAVSEAKKEAKKVVDEVKREAKKVVDEAKKVVDEVKKETKNTVDREVKKAEEKKTLQIIENCWRNGMKVENIAVIVELEVERVRGIVEELK